ncbi:MAG: hypothetical protein CSYNP_00301 [Syntrophus sp. SKADARSKE-3]|nr:hypothetical protein [Syntrophus sp. SKADARSKE-3]
MFQWLVVLYFLFAYFTTPSFADAINPGETDRNLLKRRAIEYNLHKNPYWFNLLYYRPNSFTGEVRSEANAPDFFLSTDGKLNPLGELLATIDAAFLPTDLDNRHPLCVFPARTTWLVNQLQIPETEIPHPDCSRLKQWRREFKPTQVSLIMPAAYLNNPSSLFGHAFLKFDVSNDGQSNGLMAFTMNFAADTASRTGIIDYIHRGLWGGFPSDNSIMRFYRMVKQYSDIENRDIWEFKLNLTPEEMELLILHIWELKDRNIFNYYFLDENCAYRIIALLDIARPDLHLRNRFHLYTIPADAIRALRENGAIEETVYKASAVKAFLYYTEQLDDNEKRWIKNIVVKKVSLEKEQLSALSYDRIPLVLSIASEYLGLLINSDVLNRKASAKLERSLFLERLHQDVPTKFNEISPPDTSPDMGHKGRRVFFGVGRNDFGDFVSLGYRELYHSFMDPLPGFNKGMEIELLSTELRRYENGDIKLQKIDLLNIASYSPINTFFYPMSWRVRLGREEREFDDRHPVNYFEGNWGITVPVGSVSASALIGLSLENSGVFSHDFGLGAGADLDLLYQGAIWSFRLGVQSKKYIDSDLGSIAKVFAEMSLPVSRNLTISSMMMTSCNHWKCYYENNIAIRYFF